MRNWFIISLNALFVNYNCLMLLICKTKLRQYACKISKHAESRTRGNNLYFRIWGIILAKLERIKAKLNKLKNIDVNFEVFGSKTHKYSLNPVLTENEIVSFEKKHNLTIPEEYRLFIREMGNGGAGPFYGLLPLEDNEDQIVDLDSDFHLAFEKPLILENLEKFKEYDEKIEAAFQSGKMDEEQALWDLKESMIEKEYLAAAKGIKFLCHEGCCMFNILVMRGKEKGTVWWFDFSEGGSFSGVVPLSLGEKKMTFFDWYEIWLDNSLEYFENKNAALSSYAKFVYFG